MKKSINTAAILLIFVLINGCQKDIWADSFTSKPIPNLIGDKKLNASIELYVDQHLSEIIKVRDYPKNVDKVFCSHQTIYVEEYENLPPTFRASGNLACSGFEIKPGRSIHELDPTVVEFTTIIEETYSNVYVGANGETPRHEPYYLGDVRRIFSREIFKKILDSRKSPNSLSFLRKIVNQKAISFYKVKNII